MKRGKFQQYLEKQLRGFGVLIVGMLISTVSLFSQPDFRFDHLTIQEGLSHNTIHSIIQDRHGYIWIGTQNGLNKYDGYNFDIYRSVNISNSETNFIGKNISKLYVDSKGHLWVGTRKHGLNVLLEDEDRFINLHDNPLYSEIQDAEISSIYEDRKGFMWIGTVGKGLLKVDLDKNKSYHFTAEEKGLISNSVFDILEDNNGSIWVATAGDGVNRMEGDSIFISVNNDSKTMSGYRKQLLLDGEDMWIGTEGSGLHKINLNDYSFNEYREGNTKNDLDSDACRGLFKYGEDYLLITTDGGGLNVLDLKSGVVYKYKAEAENIASLNSNALNNVISDFSGNIWIGSFNGGINLIKNNKTWFDSFFPISKSGSKLEQKSILSIFEDYDRNIWIGTDGGGINKIKPTANGYEIESISSLGDGEEGLIGNVVKSIFEDHNENVWLGTFYNGLNIYDPKKKKYRHLTTENGLNGLHVWAINQSKDSTIWIGTIDRGITTYHYKRGFEYFNNNPNERCSVSSENIMCILISSEDEVWIGNADHGIDIWEESENCFRHYRHDPMDVMSLSNDEVRCIFEDSRKRIWIGTEGGGLNLWLGDGKFKRILLEEGLLSNSVMGITEDDNGYLWISTFDGISRYDVENNLFRNFDFHDKTNVNQFNQNAILRGSDGKLYFGGINGMNTISPNEIKEEKGAGKLKFTKLKVLNQQVFKSLQREKSKKLTEPIETAKEIKLDYLDKSLTIHFSSFDFIDTYDDRFEYMLENFDQKWRQTDPGQNSISYTNLDPGKYRLIVRNESDEASIIIISNPPFWKTPWFYAISILLFLVIGTSTLMFIMKRRENEQNRKLLRAEKEILELKNKSLETDVNISNSKILSSTAQMAHKNEVLSEIKQELETQKKSDSFKLDPLIRKINMELKNEDYWDEFNIYFNKVDKNFIRTLLSMFPDLTQNDLRICALLRLNLNTKEIASLLNVSVRGVEKGKYRLKKRLNLGKDDDLLRFIRTFKV